MLAGSLITFRRGLKPLRHYTLRFSMLCWDERFSYMGFEFRCAGQTMAMGHTKGLIHGPQGIVSGQETFAALGMDATSPAFPRAVQSWIDLDHQIGA